MSLPHYGIVIAIAWSAIGLLAATLGVLGTVAYGSLARIDGVGESLGARIDAQGASLGARIDGVAESLGARIDAQSASLGARIDAQTARIDALFVRSDP